MKGTPEAQEHCMPALSEPHLNDLQHLQSCDAPVAVQIVHLKGPVELLLEAATGGDRQGADELPEVDGAVPVLVEGSEGMLCKLGGVSVREELRQGCGLLGRNNFTLPAYPNLLSSASRSPVPVHPATPRPTHHLDVELLKLLQVEDTAGTVLQETLVPLL